MTPRSRGRLKLTSRDPGAAPLLDHGYLSDPDGEDARVLVDGRHVARQLASAPRLARLLGKEQSPGADRRSTGQVAEFTRATVAHYFHPVGTCAMGPAPGRAAVVDARGRVHGLENCYVGDVSLMPVVPRANTNIPALVASCGASQTGCLGPDDAALAHRLPGNTRPASNPFTNLPGVYNRQTSRFARL